MDLFQTSVTVFICLILRVTVAIPRENESQYYVDDTATKTVQTEFTQEEIIPTTASAVDDTVVNAGHTDTGHQSDGSDCFMNKMECNKRVKQCGSRIFTIMAAKEDEDYDHYTELDKTDPCRCVFHCFEHSKACSYLTKRMDRVREHRRRHGDEHNVFNHLGELIGTFAAGSVVGIFITLLIVNLMKKCTQGYVEQPSREMRAMSSAGLNASLRAPMPSPIPASEGFYTEGPIGLSPSPELSRVPSKTFYEDLDELAMSSRPQNKEPGLNMYFTLEKDIEVDKKDSESDDEDADNMPSESTRTPRTSTSPDIVPEVQNSKL